MWVLYMIRTADRRRSYVGVTVNLQRRLRQHNGIIKGGAKATRGRGPWLLVFTVGLLPKRPALQLEWAMHHTRRLKGAPQNPRRVEPTRRRIHDLLCAVLPRPRWTSKAPYCYGSSNAPLTIEYHVRGDRPVYAKPGQRVILLRDLVFDSYRPVWLRTFLGTCPTCNM